MDPSEVRRLLGDWRAANGPLYRALAGALTGLVDAGHLEPGSVLPAERRLARELAVSRNTIVAAYALLRDAGRVHSRQGSGTTVVGRDALSPRAARIAGSLTPNGVFDGFVSPLADAIDLRAGYWIGTNDLPADTFDLASDPRHHHVLGGSGYHPHGVPELRAALAARLTSQGLPTTPEEILVTTGAQQALALLTSLLIDPGDAVLVEDATYPGAIDLFRAYGAHVHAVRRDQLGPNPGDLRRRREQLDPRLAYLVLSGHNPTGTTAPEALRAALARAVDDGLVVVEDESLADTGSADPPPPLAAYVRGDARGHVITVGSLSKAVWGGLRIGWLRAPTPLIDRLLRLKTIHDIGTPASSQVVAVRLVDELPQLLARRRPAIARRRARLEAELRALLPDWSWETPNAGLSLWIDLGANSIDFAAHAARFGVEIAPGTICSPSGAHAHRLRLPYGQPDDVLLAGVRRLADAWHDDARRTAGRQRVSLML